MPFRSSTHCGIPTTSSCTCGSPVPTSPWWLLVDFNLGTVVKDAFAIPAGSEEFVGFWNAQAAPGEATIEPLPLAEARARIEEAIETGAQTWPPLESDSWPASRPLLEWVLRQLPTGGKGFVRPAWSERRLDRLTQRFLSSPWAAELDPSDAASIVESLLWYPHRLRLRRSAAVEPGCSGDLDARLVSAQGDGRSGLSAPDADGAAGVRRFCPRRGQAVGRP